MENLQSTSVASSTLQVGTNQSLSSEDGNQEESKTISNAREHLHKPDMHGYILGEGQVGYHSKINRESTLLKMEPAADQGYYS